MRPECLNAGVKICGLVSMNILSEAAKLEGLLYI